MIFKRLKGSAWVVDLKDESQHQSGLCSMNQGIHVRLNDPFGGPSSTGSDVISV